MKNSLIHLSRTKLFLFLYLLLAPLLHQKLVAGAPFDPPQSTISGTITDMNGLPLGGVNIRVPSTNRGTVPIAFKLVPMTY